MIMKNPLQRLVDEWYDWYVREYGHAPAWSVFTDKVNEFKFLLDIDWAETIKKIFLKSIDFFLSIVYYKYRVKKEVHAMRNIKKKVTKSFAQYGEVLRTRKNMNHSFRGKCKRELLKSCWQQQQSVLL